MLFVISPAKSLDDTLVSDHIPESQAEFLEQSSQLVEQLKGLEPVDLAGLMGVSESLAELNYQRIQKWQLPMDIEQSRQAVYLFKGDVYQGLDVRSLSDSQLSYLQSHLYILSGLYGLLKPLDKILPYRLEMGTHFANVKGKNLYQFWGVQLVERVNQYFLDESKAKNSSVGNILVNLASNEYFKALKNPALNATVVTPHFKDWKNGQYKMISFYAKKARGLMVRYAAENQIVDVEDLKCFDSEGYRFALELSSELDWVFTRKV